MECHIRVLKVAHLVFFQELPQRPKSDKKKALSNKQSKAKYPLGSTNIAGWNIPIFH